MRHQSQRPVAPVGAPFATVEELVFWAVPALVARMEGARVVAGATPRPCEPVDFQVVVAALVRSGSLVAMHMRALATFGQLGCPPDRHAPGEARYLPWWNEALDALYGPLVCKGIVLARGP